MCELCAQCGDPTPYPSARLCRSCIQRQARMRADWRKRHPPRQRQGEVDIQLLVRRANFDLDSAVHELAAVGVIDLAGPLEIIDLTGDDDVPPSRFRRCRLCANAAVPSRTHCGECLDVFKNS